MIYDAYLPQVQVHIITDRNIARGQAGGYFWLQQSSRSQSINHWPIYHVHISRQSFDHDKRPVSSMALKGYYAPELLKPVHPACQRRSWDGTSWRWRPYTHRLWTWLECYVCSEYVLEYPCSWILLCREMDRIDIALIQRIRM